MGKDQMLNFKTALDGNNSYVGTFKLLLSKCYTATRKNWKYGSNLWKWTTVYESENDVHY